MILIPACHLPSERFQQTPLNREVRPDCGRWLAVFCADVADRRLERWLSSPL